MSLYETAEGILETHVTWKDVEQSLQKSLSTKASFGPNKKATNISDMKGFMSRIALVEPDWVGVEEGKELPERFIVKMSSQLAIASFSKTMSFGIDGGFSEEKLAGLAKVTRNIHNREVGAYRLLTKFNHPDIPFTKIYAMKSFEDEDDMKGFIIAEYIPDLNSNMFKSVTADDLIPVVRAIATFAALGETIPAEEKQFADGKQYFEGLLGMLFEDSKLEQSFEGIKMIFGEEQSEKVDKAVEVLWIYKNMLSRYLELSQSHDFKLVLNHGDMWISNILHRLDENGKMKMLALIDWQGVSMMSPGLDLSRLLIGTLSPEDRKARAVELLHLYHDTFKATLGKELFSFEELFNSYNLHLPIMAIVILPGCIPFLNQAQLPEEQRTQIRGMMMHMMTGIMDDILEAHQHNLKTFPDFIQ